MSTRYTPRHAAPVARRRPVRKSRTVRSRLLVGLVSFALAIGGGVAFAAILGKAGLSGTVKSGDFLATWSGTTHQARTSSLDGTQTLGIIQNATLSADRLTLTLPAHGVNFPEPFPGEEVIRVTSSVTLDGKSSRNGYVSGLAVTGTLPAGWTATLANGCKAPLSKADTAGKPVEIVLSPTAAGSTVNLATVGLGVKVTPLPPNVSTVPADATCDATLSGAAS